MRDSHLTNGQIECLLQKIGYRRTGFLPPKGLVPRQQVWENEEADALKFLPDAPSEPARLHHLMTIRKISIEKGMVDEETFERLLREVECGEEPALARNAA